ncbi:PAS domain-containing hybrid sensor histidine kinase/response regulator [Cupriavidus pampae]|uniref:histidine kinase n=1 Tax=Cupriavidus pampae TaxID=659251 RepID=A0ABN7YD11_9BURK|nr:ATP-binding protein [Cupriavidus pampae]CAG9171287.1 Sensor histidine kinase RcsC [Cupriavidus pampae]
MWQRQTPVLQSAREVSAGTHAGVVPRGAAPYPSHPAWLDALQDVAVFDLASDGHIQQWSEAARRVLGYVDDEVVGRHVSCLLARGDPDGELLAAGVHHASAATSPTDQPDEAIVATCAQWLDAARAQASAEWRGWCARRDGSVFYAHLNAVTHAEGLAVACHDVTVRHAAEERAGQAEARRAQLANALHDHAVCELSLDGMILEWSDGATALTGYSASEAIGQPVSLLYSRQDIAAGNDLAAHDAVRAQGQWSGEERLQRKDGTLVRCRLRQALTRDAAACPIGILWTARDMSDAARLQELEGAGRRVQAFLAILAHELRNPLAPIRNAVDVIRLSSPEEGRIRHCADIIGRQVHLLTRLVTDLMDVGRVTTGKLKVQLAPTMYNEIVSTSLEAIRPVLDVAGQRLTVTLPTDPVFVNADSGRLGQVLSNLLSNATKYTPRGGAISVEVTTDGRNVITTIADTGQGVAPEAIDRIFNLFAQESDAVGQRGGLAGGLGIGLALARAVVEAHGGAIQASSPGEGRGSTFTVILPEVEMDGAAVIPEAPDDSVVRRVLIVDDNTDSADSMVELLAVLGHEARAAYGGAQALEVARAFVPDVVLLDLEMPDMDGYEVLAAMRAGGLRARVFALTGRGTADDRRRALDAGFAEHLVKPLTVELLTGALRA